MITYERLVADDAAPDALRLTEAHVRAHLSAVADADDDPETNADDVRIRLVTMPGGVMVRGTLEAEPQVAYQQPGFDPYEGVPDELRAEAG